ncbi:MAG: antibiotic biosynthesis monooxygenase [Chitinophagales bacterium]|nr:antibiotic biosynthesis monooxygenase [Chitinophagales bacterium]
MITRIVKMEFRSDEVDSFVKRYWEVQPVISGFEGCTHVELLRDVNHNNVFFTYSKWESEEHLNTYRNSEFFKQTWIWTKALFINKPMAWSVEEQIKS